jgi:hypothetical protein
MVKIKIKKIILCPDCDEELGSIDYQLDYVKKYKTETSFGPWYCQKCTFGFNGKISVDGSISLEKSKGFCKSTLVLLEYVPRKNEKLYLIVDGFKFEHSNEDNNRYFHEEHTCPSNDFRATRAVLAGDKILSTDPHGIMKYLTSMDIKQEDKLSIIDNNTIKLLLDKAEIQSEIE